tara:strand:+ start:250 stop:540 length:291 start_codon:yes stop_codon:yes gene_type:complete
MLLKLIIILIFIVILFYIRNFLKFNSKKKVFKTRNLMTFNKKNLNNWMNLTRKERYNLSTQESVNYLDKRKLLLEEIRKEYKKISRENSGKNINKK